MPRMSAAPHPIRASLALVAAMLLAQRLLSPVGSCRRSTTARSPLLHARTLALLPRRRTNTTAKNRTCTNPARMRWERRRQRSRLSLRSLPRRFCLACCPLPDEHIDSFSVTARVSGHCRDAHQSPPELFTPTRRRNGDDSAPGKLPRQCTRLLPCDLFAGTKRPIISTQSNDGRIPGKAPKTCASEIGSWAHSRGIGERLETKH